MIQLQEQRKARKGFERQRGMPYHLKTQLSSKGGRTKYDNRTKHLAVISHQPKADEISPENSHTFLGDLSPCVVTNDNFLLRSVNYVDMKFEKSYALGISQRKRYRNDRFFSLVSSSYPSSGARLQRAPFNNKL